MKKHKLALSLFVALSFTHYVLQFFAWSYASGNTALAADNLGYWQHIAWPVLSFPAFWLFSNWATEYFGTVSLFNSLFWGFLLTKTFLWVKDKRAGRSN